MKVTPNSQEIKHVWQQLLDKDVQIEGIYQSVDTRYSNRCAVALADVRIFDLQGKELPWEKDHTWVQDAWQIQPIKPSRGDKLSAIVTVREYRKLSGTVQIGFTYPRKVECQPFQID